MAEITGQSLIQDWYDRYVLPKKAMKDAFSGVKPDFSMGAPPSTAPMGYRGPGITPPPSLETPIPAAAPVMPAEQNPEDQLREEFNLDTAVGNQDTFADPSLDVAPEKAAPTSSKWSNVSEGLKDPLAQGILGMGLSMMSTPPRAVKYSGAEIIGKSGLAGLGIFEKAVEAKRKQQALDQTAEEHKLNREELKLYRQGQLKVSEENAASNRISREALATDRTAKAKNEAALDMPIDARTAEYYGVSPSMTVRQFQAQQGGLIASKKPAPTAWKQVNFNGKDQWVDLNSPEAKDLAQQGAFGVTNKPGFVYFVGNDGSITEVQKGGGAEAPPKVVAPPGTGKTAPPPKPPGGGSAAGKQYEDWKVAFKKQYGRDPNADETRTYKAGGPTGKAAQEAKPNARNDPKVYLKKAKNRDQAKRRIKAMADAGWTRAQIQEALKGTQWE